MQGSHRTPSRRLCVHQFSKMSYKTTGVFQSLNVHWEDRRPHLVHRQNYYVGGSGPLPFAKVSVATSIVCTFGGVHSSFSLCIEAASCREKTLPIGASRSLLFIFFLHWMIYLRKLPSQLVCVKRILSLGAQMAARRL
jgi:hypothetical protein